MNIILKSHRLKLLLLLAIILLISAFNFADLFAEKPYKDVSNKQLKALIQAKKITIIDIRRPEEWQQTGVIKNSKLLTLFDAQGRINPEFTNKIRLLAKDTPIALICRTGSRTKVASKYLSKKLGYSNIYNVKKGILNWIANNNPVVSDQLAIKL